MENTDRKKYNALEHKQSEFRNELKKDRKLLREIQKRIEDHEKQIEKIEAEQIGIIQYQLWKR